MKKISFIIFIFSVSFFNSYGQKDWSSVNFTDEYKGSFKIPGAAVKSIQSNPTFINSYTIFQATMMKNSNVDYSKGKSVHSEVSLTGIDIELYQKMVNELKIDLETKLNEAQIKTTTGEDALKCDYALKQISKAGKSEIIGNSGNCSGFPSKNVVNDGAWHGYQVLFVKEDLIFKPQNTLEYNTTDLMKMGLFYQKLSTSANVNLLSIRYNLTFASFSNSSGYKDIKIATAPVLAITVSISYVTPNGSYNKLYYQKLPAWGDDYWSEGIFKTEERLGEYWGLSNSAEFQILANNQKYIESVKSLIKALQADIVKGITSNF